MVKRFLAGAVFGIYIAYLLYFLNPQLPVSPGRILAACAAYALICGAGAGGALWLARMVRLAIFGSEGLPPRRQGFGMIAAAVFAASAVYWYHLAVYRIYLPRGAVRILSKATTLVAATAFVMFVLWLFDRASTRTRSRMLIAIGCVVVLLSCVLLYQRREGYRATTHAVAATSIADLSPSAAFRVVAIRGLSYDWLVRLQGEGWVSHLDSLSDSGYRTRVVPFRTSSPKAVWASLATGQLPARHGVTGRFSYRTLLSSGDESFSLLPGGVGFRAWGLIPPVERLSAQVPAGASAPFWSAFQRTDASTIVVNWEGASPANTAAAAVVSDRWIRGIDESQQEVRPRPLALLADSVIPQDLLLRIAPLAEPVRTQVIAAMKEDVRAADALLAAASSVDAALQVVALNGLARTVDALGLDDNSLPEPGSPRGVALRTHIELIDRIVGRLRPEDPGTAFVIVSPSAAFPPAIPGSFPALTSLLEERLEPGRNDGVLLLSGPQFRVRPNPDSIDVTDVVPTLLYASSLPIARDMDGEIVLESFVEQPQGMRSVSFIPSYDEPPHR